MAYVKTQWVNNEEPSIDADNLNHMEQGIYDAQYPDNGQTGQLLSKTANGTAWVDAPNSAVWGLIQGQLNEQEDLYAELEHRVMAPSASGSTGQFLQKTATGTAWADAGTDVELTQAEYDALPSSKTSDDINYFITDGQPNPSLNNISAGSVIYDNTVSGLDAEQTQDAIDEVASDITDLKNGLITTVIQKGTYNLTGLMLNGRTTGSGNYVDLSLPIKLASDISSATLSEVRGGLYMAGQSTSTDVFDSSYCLLTKTSLGDVIEFKLTSTKSGNTISTVNFTGGTITFS